MHLVLKRGTESQILIFFLTIIAIISSGYALSNVYDFHISYAILVVSILFIGQASRKYDYKIDGINLALLLAFSVGVFFAFVFSGFDNIQSYMAQICVPILAFEISLIYDARKMIAYYLNVMFFLATIGIVFHIAVNYLGMSLPLVVGHNCTYGNAWIYVYILNRTVRNCGLFWEPCIFASFLSIALFFAIILKNIKHKTIKKFVLIFAIITAKSSTGFALLAIDIIIGFLQKNNLNSSASNKADTKNIRVAANLFLTIVIVFVILNSDKIILSIFPDNQYLMKLLSSNVVRSSRADSIFECIQIFLGSPLFGVGIDKFQYFISNFDYADTATSFSMLAKYGLVGLIYTGLIIKGAFTFGDALIQKILITLLFLIVVNTIPHHTFLITWIIIFSLSRMKKMGSTEADALEIL